MCSFGVLELTCEAPATVAGEGKKKREILGPSPCGAPPCGAPPCGFAPSPIRASLNVL